MVAFDLDILAMCCAELRSKIADDPQRRAFEIQTLHALSDGQKYIAVFFDEQNMHTEVAKAFCAEVASHGGKCIGANFATENDTACFLFELPIDFQADFEVIYDSHFGSMSELG